MWRSNRIIAYMTKQKTTLGCLDGAGNISFLLVCGDVRRPPYSAPKEKFGKAGVDEQKAGGSKKH